MVSIIISSKNPALMKQLSKNILETVGTEHEIITINNPGLMGISKAYNIGAKKAKYNYLVFCHEDILFHTLSWGYKIEGHLKNRKNSLIGILGCTIKTKTPCGVYSGIQKLNRINQLQKITDTSPVHYYNNPNNEQESSVAVLDGMFLATTKSNWQKCPFDEEKLVGFHGYDIDFSLSQQKNGNVVVVYDILIEHFSSGGNTKEWIDAQMEIVMKWQFILPLNFEKKNRKKLLKSADYENAKEFILALFKNKYKFKLARKMAIVCILKQPFRRINLTFLKQILLKTE
jgi:hypothetical protein